MDLNPIVIPRMDLLAAPSNPIKGFIGERVLPNLPVYQWSGSRPMAAVITTTTVSGRSGGAGTSILSNTHAANLVAYDMSTSEVIDREAIGQAEIAMFGSKEAAERVLAFTGTLRVKTSIETAIYNALVAKNVTDATGDVYAGILNAVLLLQPFGRVGLAGSVQAWNAVRALPKIGEVLKATGVPLTTVADVRSISASQLAAAFRADEVLEAITPSVIWAANKIVAYVIADETADPAAFPQVGRNLKYAWTLDAGKSVDMICEEKYDVTVNKPVLDFISYSAPKIANDAFIYTLTIG